MLGHLLDGRYQVLQVLGRGGFGQTYIAQDTHRPGFPKCVVKHLKPVTRSPEFLETARRLFTSEAETLEQLGNHDQIPRLLAYFEENQEFFLVQEFIQGHTLKAELFPNQHWTEEKVIQLLQQMLGILQFIHSHNVIHRDIKPDNIIRRQQDGKLVLIDFGAVKQVQTQLLTVAGQMGATIIIGTPGYMSTEQGQGKPRPNSDIYSLGIIGIQSLTGLHPINFEEDPDTGEISWQHQANVSSELASVLSKMVLHHFKQRYQSAAEVLRVLKDLDTNTKVEAQSLQPPSFTQPPQAS
ncbi:serine/threonine-protein kinase, partial [Nostoc sp.]